MRTIVFYVTICCYRNKKATLICFLLENVVITLIFTTYLKANFTCSKNTIRNIFIIFILFKQTLRVIILLLLDIAGLDMNLEE